MAECQLKAAFWFTLPGIFFIPVSSNFPHVIFLNDFNFKLFFFFSVIRNPKGVFTLSFRNPSDTIPVQNIPKQRVYTCRKQQG